MTVFVTSGGNRYHANPACYALATGRSTQAYRAGEGLYGESWYGAGNLDGLYPVAAIPIEALARSRYTACRVCVPPALALPPTGRTYGHKPVTGVTFGGAVDTVCQRCTVPGLVWGWDAHLVRLPWPCTSAVVLGLVPRCPDCGNGIDVPGSRKCASCEHCDQIDAWGTAL